MKRKREICTEGKTYTIVLTGVTSDRRRAELRKAGFEYNLSEPGFIKKNVSRKEVLEIHELIQSGAWPKISMRFRANAIISPEGPRDALRCG